MSDTGSGLHCEICNYGNGGHAVWCGWYRELQFENEKLKAELEQANNRIAELIKVNEELQGMINAFYAPFGIPPELLESDE